MESKPVKSGFYQFQPKQGPGSLYQATEFDGKRLRKAIDRKTVDYNTSIVNALESRLFTSSYRDRKAFQPDIGYYTQLLPPSCLLDNPMNCVTTKFVRTSTNKMRCPIFCVLWTPEGRRLVTGAHSGEFTLWNGLTFNFETILQAHDASVRVMIWNRSDAWMVTGDHAGYVKYWQSNMNNVKMFQAHKEPVRALSFCPTDTKLASCSDDGTIRLFDFLTCVEERILRGHGADVKCLHWHPTSALIASGSKDNQQPVKLWDPRAGISLATLHAHKSTVTDLKWNQNGNWLLTASRDHHVKLFDVRNLSQEVQQFRGHKKEVACLAWHPIHEGLFASGGNDGSILFFEAGTKEEIGSMEQAHESVVWSLSWHPLGHILASGSNDHTCKFWTRNRPGSKMKDKYNLNLMQKGHKDDIDDIVTAEYDEYDEAAFAIPGLGITGQEAHIEIEEPEAKSQTLQQQQQPQYQQQPNSNSYYQHRKQPYTKPVPKQFENLWENKSSGAPAANETARVADNHFSTPSETQQSQQFDQQLAHQEANNMMRNGLTVPPPILPTGPPSIPNTASNASLPNTSVPPPFNLPSLNGQLPSHPPPPIPGSLPAQMPQSAATGQLNTMSFPPPDIQMLMHQQHHSQQQPHQQMMQLPPPQIAGQGELSSVPNPFGHQQQMQQQQIPRPEFNPSTFQANAPPPMPFPQSFAPPSQPPPQFGMAAPPQFPPPAFNNNPHSHFNNNFHANGPNRRFRLDHVKHKKRRLN